MSYQVNLQMPLQPWEEADQSGYVSRQTIIDKITNEFELTIDVAQFLEVLELQSDQLDFQAFCQMFEKEDKGMSRGGSVLSVKLINII